MVGSACRDILTPEAPCENILERACRTNILTPVRNPGTARGALNPGMIVGQSRLWQEVLVPRMTIIVIVIDDEDDEDEDVEDVEDEVSRKV